VESGGQLVHSGDCAWSQWKDPGSHYTEPHVAYAWGTGPTTFMFDIVVFPNTPQDYYDLVFAVAGKYDNGDLFYWDEHFYLHVGPLPGDCDEDGDVDLNDFSVFSNCMGGPENAVVPPSCPGPDQFDAADLDDDGDVDLQDAAVFWIYFTG
jgi:hypothetical protein